MTKINIVIPCKNEEENIKKIFEKLIDHTVKQKFEININFEFYFIDDGSVDNTIKEIKSLCSEFKNIYDIYYIKLSFSCGKDLAIASVLERMHKNDAVILIDADLQHPPEKIPDLINLYLKKKESVFMERKSIKTSIFRKIYSNIFYLILKFTLGEKKQFKKNITEFCILDKKVINFLIQDKSKNFNLKSNLRYASDGYKNTLIFTAPERANGNSNYNFNNLFDLALDVITFNNTKPIKYVLFFGFIIFISSILMVFYMILVDWILRISNFKYITFVIVYNTSLFGLIIFLLGFIGIYIGNINQEVLKNKRFIISEDNI